MVRIKHEVSLPKEMHNFIEMEKFSPHERKLFLIQLRLPVVISSSLLLKVRNPKDKTGLKHFTILKSHSCQAQIKIERIER